MEHGLRSGQRRADRAARERLERNGLAGGDPYDRLELDGDQPLLALVEQIGAHHVGAERTRDLRGHSPHDVLAGVRLRQHPSHREQGSMIRRYIAWRNRHTTDPRLRKVIKRASAITRAKVA